MIRFLKWAGLVLCIVIFVVWVASIWAGIGYTCSYGGQPRTISVVRGGVYWFRSTQQKDTGVVHFHAASFPHGWLPDYHGGLGPGATIWYMPLWCPLILVALPTAYLYNRDRRPPPGHCLKCSYDLTGNVSGVCPECGTKLL